MFGQGRGKRVPLHRQRPWIKLITVRKIFALTLVAAPLLALVWLWKRQVVYNLQTKRRLVDQKSGGARRSSNEECRLNVAQLQLLRNAATEKRWSIYSNLANDISSRGLHIQGTQGVKVSNMFRMDNSGKLEAVLQALDVPVRAIILPFEDTETQQRLRESVQRHIMPLVSEAGIWLQDSSIYHSTLYHASSHQHPVPADELQVAGELRNIRAAAETMCPLRAVLAGIVATRSGVIMATWQVFSGTEPALMRELLGRSLPRAPPPLQQTVREPEILHTTLARLVEEPIVQPDDIDEFARGETADAGRLSPAAEALLEAVEAMTAELCGLRTTLHSLRFVQEEHLLALALGGRYMESEAVLMCKNEEG